MLELLSNFMSKKFGVIIFTIWVLYDFTGKYPDKAIILASMICGMAVAYSALEVADKILSKKYKIEEPK